jgi:5-methylcytosine-specific restriction protein A
MGGGRLMAARSDDGPAAATHARDERAKARALRQSQWWKRRCAPGICHYCGQQVGAPALTMDHLVPLSRGGRSNKGNLVPACKDCNNRKKHRLAFEDW